MTLRVGALLALLVAAGAALAQASVLADIESGPLAAAAFAPPPAAVAPAAPRAGRVRLIGQRPADGHRVLRDTFDRAGAPGIFHVPALDLQWVADAGVVRPLLRGRRPAPDGYWEWVVQPGRIWARGGGRWRASFPVALQERNADCTHTGWLAIDGDGHAETATAALQIGAETCAYFQFDLWARLPAEFEALDGPPAAPRDGAPLERLPIEALAETHPGVDPAAFGSPLEVTPTAMTAYGLLADDVLYSGGCGTRFGRDPFCADLPMPSYSLAKSLVAGLGLMRLERLYPGARNARVADYVPQCAGARWADVTFEHALDMATGLYTSAEYDVDEGAPAFRDFMSRSSHAERIERACNAHPRKAEPGLRWVYHSTDSYVLGAALQGFWRARSGRSDADFYDDLLVPLWHRLGLSPLLDASRRSYDDERQPVTGWGLLMTLDDMMRLGRFLQDGGRVDGDAWADPALLAAALQRTPEDRGLQAGGPWQRYQNGFWAWNAGPALGCAGDAWIPAMSGYGGITLALIPNGHVYAYVSDDGQFAWRRAAQASHAMEPFCEVVR